MKLSILCCSNFKKEVYSALHAEGAEDVAVSFFPARCGRPPLTWDEVQRLIPSGCEQTVVVGSACVNDLDQPPPDFPGVRVMLLKQCFYLVAGEQMVEDAITGGTYLVTPGWLSEWREQLRIMGFDSEKAAAFFQDFTKDLLLLDTGTDPQASTRLSELQTALKVPVRRIAVGLDYTRLFLARLILEWRLEQSRLSERDQRRSQSSKLADYAAAMDMLERLAKTHDETDTITSIKDMFKMLFAPASLHYLRVDNQVPIVDKPIPDKILKLMHDLRENYAWTPDGKGFLLRIKRNEKVLGLIAVDQLSFPKYRQRYLNMALAVTGFCGLAVENARNRRRLLEAEKLGSLANMVAGIAHEINTPLGVSITTVSMLQDQSRNLAEQFAERSLTQTDLKTYLEQAREETSLISGNLARIGSLVESFRQVAVGGKSIEKSLFLFKDCLDEVILSMGHLVSRDRFIIKVDCDPALEVEGVPGDWNTVFSNLIDNSFKHGFMDREKGVINITISTTEKHIKVEYRDDGIGMDPEALSKIFEPFYTTDMQNSMGLGMHLLHNLVTHRMNGIIRCTSPSGQGVCYHIEVPK